MIRVAIIGTGGISDSHIWGYLEFPKECKIVALCDIYPEKAEQKAQKYALQAKVYDDHRAMLNDGTLTWFRFAHRRMFMQKSQSMRSRRANMSSSKNRWRHHCKNATECSPPRKPAKDFFPSSRKIVSKRRTGI